MGVCGVQVCMCDVCDVEVMVNHSKGIAAIVISLRWVFGNSTELHVHCRHILRTHLAVTMCQ